MQDNLIMKYFQNQLKYLSLIQNKLDKKNILKFYNKNQKEFLQ